MTMVPDGGTGTGTGLHRAVLKQQTESGTSNAVDDASNFNSQQNIPTHQSAVGSYALPVKQGKQAVKRKGNRVGNQGHSSATGGDHNPSEATIDVTNSRSINITHEALR
jgi:hypothetical protein